MSPENCNAKRIEHLRLARETKALGNDALSNRHWLLAVNYRRMADPAKHDHMLPFLEKNTRRLNEALAARDAQS